MDVLCPLCNTRHALDTTAARARARKTVRFRCSTCGHTFTLNLEQKPPTEPPPGRSSVGEVTALKPVSYVRVDGENFGVPDLATLQRWVLEKRVLREDLCSADGAQWAALGARPELQLFFAAADRLDRSSTSAQHALLTMAHSSSEDIFADAPLPGASDDSGWLTDARTEFNPGADLGGHPPPEHEEEPAEPLEAGEAEEEDDEGGGDLQRRQLTFGGGRVEELPDLKTSAGTADPPSFPELAPQGTATVRMAPPALLEGEESTRTPSSAAVPAAPKPVAEGPGAPVEKISADPVLVRDTVVSSTPSPVRTVTPPNNEELGGDSAWAESVEPPSSAAVSAPSVTTQEMPSRPKLTPVKPGVPVSTTNPTSPRVPTVPRVPTETTVPTAPRVDDAAARADEAAPPRITPAPAPPVDDPRPSPLVWVGLGIGAIIAVGLFVWSQDPSRHAATEPADPPAAEAPPAETIVRAGDRQVTPEQDAEQAPPSLPTDAALPTTPPSPTLLGPEGFETTEQLRAAAEKAAAEQVAAEKAAADKAAAAKAAKAAADKAAADKAAADKARATQVVAGSSTTTVTPTKLTGRAAAASGWAAVEKEDWGSAKSRFQAVLQDEPSNSWAMYGRGYVEEHTGNVDAAVKDYCLAIGRTKNTEILRELEAGLRRLDRNCPE